MSILINRENSCLLMRNINKQLLLKYSTLKMEFTISPPPNHQILSTFKIWKSSFHQLINHQISNLKAEKQLHFEVQQEQLMTDMIDKYKHDQQFNQLMKNVNSTVETIKDFIRTVSIKDPATEVTIN